MPASQRGSQAWFAQPAASPGALLAAPAGVGSAAEQQAAAAGRSWSKAGRYLLASMARLQRLWEVRLAAGLLEMCRLAALVAAAVLMFCTLFCPAWQPPS